MHTFDKVLAPLRASRVALLPYAENIQSGYRDAEKFARAKAHALVRNPPKAARLLTNRYVLISLAAGACLFAVNRFRRWRNNQATPQHSAGRGRANGATTRVAPRKRTRTTTRAARVH